MKKIILTGMLVVIFLLMSQGIINYIISLPVYTKEIESVVRITVYREKNSLDNIPLLGFMTLFEAEYKVYYAPQKIGGFTVYEHIDVLEDRNFDNVICEKNINNLTLKENGIIIAIIPIREKTPKIP